MSKGITLVGAVGVISRLPDPVKGTAITALMGTVVPLVGTAKLRIETMTAERVVVVAANRRRVRNHIGTVHAAAVALVAETATGFAAAMNVPSDKLVLIKTLHVDFKKRLRGAIRAEATVTPEQRAEMQSADRGSLPIEVHVTDGTGEEPVRCEMVWAWVPKKS